MIKLNININPDDIPPDKARYDQEVAHSLQQISILVPEHKESSFISRLWSYFKKEILKQQGYKCAFCEKSIVSDDAHLEHFRPKSKVHDEDNNLITRESYWWLAYDHRNYIVSCSTCNNQKGNRFPIEDNATRITATDMDSIIDLSDEGILGGEIPYVINPRYKNPEPHLKYSYEPSTMTPIVYIAGNDDAGKVTTNVLDLNRIRKKESEFKDNLPGNRGNRLFLFQKEIRRYERLKEDLSRYRLCQADHPERNWQPSIDVLEVEIGKKRQFITKQFLSYTAEFSGMCKFWLKNATELEDDFTEEVALG